MDDHLKRCSRCVLSSSTPYIAFDENGVCNYCHDHQAILYKGEEELLRQLEKFKNKDRKYECIVALSGGRDSSFTLLKLVKDYKMKVLAVNYDNPFTDPQAKKNIENAVSILNVDLVTIKPRKDIHRRTFRNNLKTWIKRPALGVLPLMCIACKLMTFEILKVALKYQIHCVVGGLNRFEDTSYQKALLGVSIKETWEKTFIKSLFGVLKEIARNPGYFKPSYWTTYLKAYLFGDPYALGSRLLMYHVTLLDLFYYLEWQEEVVLSRIKSELNWDSSQSVNFTWRFDCQVALLKDLVYMKSFGVTERDDMYSKMIREGLMSREEALQRLERENTIPTDITRELVAKAGLDYDEFLKILDEHSLLRHPGQS